MFQKIKKIIGFIVIIAFALVLVYVLFARISGQTPSLFGHAMLRVSSESMEPELNIGDIIMVKKVDPSTLKKGDVITYHGKEGPVAGKLITHQIVEEPYEEDGTYYFTTRGIKVGAIDDPQINDTQVMGKVLYKIPILGSLYDFFSKWYGLAAFAAIIIIAFSTELINLISIIRNKDEETDEDVPASAHNPVFNKQFVESVEQETNEIITDLEDGL
ncbi:MAG: signal peptidase I [Ruminococcus sp.]|nr:signal peptidase I [Ruminococcus sp.]